MEIFTDVEGNYSVELVPGTYTILVEKEGYVPQNFEETLEYGQTKVLNVTLMPIVPTILEGTVVDGETSLPVEAAKLTITLSA